jgi:triosephosphate isomerase
MRKRIVAGNWKMNKTPKEGVELAKEINAKVSQLKDHSVEVIIGTPYIHLMDVAKTVNPEYIKVAAQNCAAWSHGAYTGEISAEMIRLAGAEYVILGHSERRKYFNESGEVLNAKVLLALENMLKPIFCCGEVLEERNAEKHFEVVKTQLEEGIFNLTEADFKEVVIAYEPVWAIGTGVNASPEQAQEMHQYIRKEIANKYGKVIADDTSILYGGSCKPSNASELFSNEDVDGGLIGGASLNADDFLGIITAF